MALLSGIALSPELQDRYGRHAKSCDPVSVLRVRTSRLFGEPSSSRFPRVGSACTVLLHHSLAGTLLPLWLAPYCLLRQLAPPRLSGSPRRVAPLALFTRYAIYSTVAPRVGYGIPWYCTISLDVPKVCRAPITGHSTRVSVLPLSR